MTTESAEALIARLLDLPALERADYLRRACADQPDLRERLQQLALAVGEVVSAEECPPGPSSDDDRMRAMELAFESRESAGMRIGPYKLLEKIGEGGFGRVWMAEQLEPVRRRVALKVIKTGMDTREVIARFAVEQQALALMSHPNIARVFDAGATDAGRPYFVMELVRGTPITKYCDEHQVATKERLRLFMAVCRAVQHAHQKGIIHRDLKPSNIIVTLLDGVPMPKVIDFGIAKATKEPLTPQTLFTQFHAFIGTPAYTSPEQMEMSGLDVDTRSDIYSLGVLLYELLAGQPPFDPDALMKSGLEAMRRTIRDVDPPRPSQRVRTFSGPMRTTVARQRGTEPAVLPDLLRGDLDGIVMHCLEKDRTRRYDTALDLAADVNHYLLDEPVTARPAGAAYRLQKFVRRHRLGFSAGAAAVLSLVAGLVMVSVSLVHEQSARRREAALRLVADANAAQARTAAAKSAQVAQFMTDMLKGVGPSVALGRDTTMLREILDRTVRRLDTELRDSPEVAMDLRQTLGFVYRDLGEYATAEPFLRQVVAFRRTQFGNGSAELAESLDNLGDLLRLLNKPADAEAALQEALAIRRQRFGDADPAVADTLFHLSQVPNARRSLADSAQMLTEVLAIRRKTAGPESPAIAETLEALGTVARENGEHEKAAALDAEALAMYRKVLGNDHPAVARALDSLGVSLLHVGRKAEAREAYREAFFLRRKVLGDQHPQLVVALLRYIGQIPAAEASDATIGLVEDFVAGQRQVLPRGSPLMAPPLLALATLLDRPDQDPAKAAALVREAQTLLDESLANGLPLDIEVIDAMDLYGWWKFMDGHASEGRAMSEAALRMAREAFGNTSQGVVQPNRTLAWIYFGMGRREDAVRQFDEAVRVDRAALPPGHMFLGMDVAGRGAAYRKVGRTADSQRLLEAALNAWKWGADPDTPSPRSIPPVLCELGLSLNQEGRFAEAERVLRESLRRYDGGRMLTLGLRVHPRARAESGLGTALAGEKKFAEAEPLLVHAFEELKANESSYGGDARAMVREASDAVVALYVGWGKPLKAAQWRAARP